jgi:hypothetical protein
LSSMFYRRKKKRQSAPDPQSPIELVVLAGLRFGPFVPAQPHSFKLRRRQRLLVNVMHQRFSPAGQAQLIRYLDGKGELRGGSEKDRAEAREWMSLFWHEAVARGA